MTENWELAGPKSQLKPWGFGTAAAAAPYNLGLLEMRFFFGVHEDSLLLARNKVGLQMIAEASEEILTSRNPPLNPISFEGLGTPIPRRNDDGGCRFSGSTSCSATSSALLCSWARVHPRSEAQHWLRFCTEPPRPKQKTNLNSSPMACSESHDR